MSRLCSDVVCLHEVHALSLKECSSWFSSFGFRVAFSPGTNHSRGTAILFRSSLVLKNSLCDNDGRFVACDFSFHDKSFRAVSIYAPNVRPDRDVFFTYVLSQVDPSVQTVLCGVFNSVVDRDMDRRGSSPLDYSRESSVMLTALFRDCCVLNAWRLFHPTDKSFTWTKADGSISTRIDLIGVPFAWSSFVSSCVICECPFSDHSLVSLTARVPDVMPRGPGRWKFNFSLLSDALFRNKINDFWKWWRTKKTQLPSLCQWWEVGKRKFKHIAVQYGSVKKRENDATRQGLLSLASQLKLRFDEGITSCFEVYKATFLKIAELGKVDAQAAKVRARVRWAEDGEASTSFFLRLEKKNGATNWFSAIRGDGDVVVSDLDGIRKTWFSFCSSLFTKEPVDLQIQSAMLDNLRLVLPPDEVPTCEGLLSREETFSALQGMARGKSPGSDDLPVEFYWTFWDLIGSDLVAVFNESYVSGLLPSSLRKGLISLSFKKGDRLDRKNWRPISLLNVNYKLCARVIAGRLLKVIYLVVNRDQTCGVPGCFIGENVSLLRDLVSYTSDVDVPAALLSLDQEKAFDRVDWDFMFSTFSRMGFGPSFIRWLRLLYTNIRSCVLVNGYSTSVFYPSRGVRQRCPLSPLLYVLTMEVLASSLRCHPDIVGLSLSGISSVLPVVSLYADDTSAIVFSDLGVVWVLAESF